MVQRGVAFTRVRKKSSSPFQNRSRNWAVRKIEPESGTIRYRTVSFSCEQKWYDILPFCSRVNRKTGPVQVHFPDLFGFKLVSMTTSNIEVEIRSNCTSLHFFSYFRAQYCCHPFNLNLKPRLLNHALPRNL